MSVFLISLIIAVGSGAWIYNKFQRQTGGLTQRSLTGASVAGVVIFIASLIILSLVLPKN